MMSSFLIIGGTGKVGGRLARILSEAGHSVQVASRTGGDTFFDWHQPESYQPALTGIAGVFIVGPGSASDWSNALTDLLAAAASAGTNRAVLLSARGVEFYPEGAVAKAERALMRGPVSWTILRPTHFSQNFTEAMFVPVGDKVVAPVADGAEPFIDVEDIALVAAAVLTGDDWRNEIVEISGPSAITFPEAVATLGAVSGRDLHFEDESPDNHRVRLRAAGTPEGYIGWRMAMLDGIRRGDDAYLSHGVDRVLGRPATSFADWAEREATS